ncbi:sugar transport STP1 [Fusarium circinatum]|uniref:Sugar transport STP1 n=1 Tax=Fusarium circinatum TaxID=48490 RepID=A0A8H5WV52_FUSCI|nr:sugar transport STP1 [Fusarium circinatum]
MLGMDITTYSSLVIAIGGLVYGVDTGIVATTIAHDSFKTYMYGSLDAKPQLTGAIVSTYYAGNCIGSLTSGAMMDKWGRKILVMLATLCAIIGTVIQTSSVNVGMMIAGRIIAGLATGSLLTIVPVYIAELAPPENRAYLVALKGLLTGIGYLVANWIGYAGSYAKGDVQWRVPLAMSATKMHRVITMLHAKKGEEFIQREMLEIREQLALEQAQRTSASWVELFTLRYAKRLLLACFILNMTKLSGGGVIQNYQSLFYAGLGFEGRTALLISGCYGFMGVIGQVINMAFVSDKWPRKRAMCKRSSSPIVTLPIGREADSLILGLGSFVLTIFLVLLTIMSRFYGDGSHLAGAAAGVAFIFLYSACYAIFFNSTVWVVVSEIFPQHLRGNGNAFAVFSMSVANIWLSQITPYAFEAIAWKFYFVFIALNLTAAVVYWVWLPETNQLTLEEIAGAFGDEVVKSDKLDHDHKEDISK